MKIFEIFDEAKPMPLTQFGGLFHSFKKEAFRLELMQTYRVSSEDEDFEAFRSGKDVPEDFMSDWCETIRNATNRGAAFKRVRYIEEPFTPYTRFEVQWGYETNQKAGDIVRFIDKENLDKVAIDVPCLKDFWLFDDEVCLLMEYDFYGRFMGVRQISPKHVNIFVNLKNELIQLSRPICEHRLWNRRELVSR